MAVAQRARVDPAPHGSDARWRTANYALWLYADNDKLYDEALIRGYYEAFKAAGGRARFELLHGVPGDGHLLRLYPDRWRAVADQFLATLDMYSP